MGAGAGDIGGASKLTYISKMRVHRGYLQVGPTYIEATLILHRIAQNKIESS